MTKPARSLETGTQCHMPGHGLYVPGDARPRCVRRRDAVARTFRSTTVTLVVYASKFIHTTPVLQFLTGLQPRNGLNIIFISMSCGLPTVSCGVLGFLEKLVMRYTIIMWLYTLLELEKTCSFFFIFSVLSNGNLQVSCGILWCPAVFRQALTVT